MELQTSLKHKEDRLAFTVVDYLVSCFRAFLVLKGPLFSDSASSLPVEARPQQSAVVTDWSGTPSGSVRHDIACSEREGMKLCVHRNPRLIALQSRLCYVRVTNDDDGGLKLVASRSLVIQERPGVVAYLGMGLLTWSGCSSVVLAHVSSYSAARFCRADVIFFFFSR